MTDKTYTQEDVLKAWEQEDQKGRLEVSVVDVDNGRGGYKKQTQILSKNNGGAGSLVIAVDGSGADANRQLVERARAPFIDAGEAPKEQVETDKPRRTEDGALATPTDPTTHQPEADIRNFVGGREVSAEEAEQFRQDEAEKPGRFDAKTSDDSDEEPEDEKE